ncbi:MAG: folylpolyglutamate synthase/dihydrofolate synthase family protein [Pseudomonadota bacterium]
MALDRIVRLLGRLGDPHLKLPPVIHVAGTNGKGSTIAFMAAMAQASGLAAHIYTSPHLVRFHERIRLRGAPISEEALCAALVACEEAAGDDPITFFELATCAAFVAFSEAPADLVLLEVGLGGRLDATNVIATPSVAVITPIGLDHQSYLGETVTQIAGEKAGILKAGAPGVVGRQTPEALAAIEAAAGPLAVPLRIFGQDYLAFEEHGRLVFQDEAGLLDLPKPKLIGAHQVENAGAAIAALRACQEVSVSEAAIAEGLTKADWPGRLQKIAKGPLFSALGPADDGDFELWLDGGHNGHAAAALARAMADLGERSPAPLTLVWAMQQTKDPAAFLEPFRGIADSVICTSVDTGSPTPPAALRKAAESAGLWADEAPNLAEALAKAASLARRPARILICGSLYLAGAAISLSERRET